MPRSSYVPGVPYPSSKQQQQLDAIARQQQQQGFASQQQLGQYGGQQFGGQNNLPRYEGKPAFYDAQRGIFFDGQQAIQVHAGQDAATCIEHAHGAYQQPQQQQQIFGQGYGVRVPLIQSLQQKLYQGKPAFYDPVHGVFFNGQQAYLYVPTDDANTAVELSAQGGQYSYNNPSQGSSLSAGQGYGAQGYGNQGYGERVLLPQQAAQHLAGKPAFFDAQRGLFFDGQNLYAYSPSGSQSDNLLTAIESGQQQGSSAEQRAYYQQLVAAMNANRSRYLFNA